MGDTVDKVAFVILGSPVGKERPRKGKGGHFYTPKKTRDYEKKIAVEFIRAEGLLLSQKPLHIRLWARFPGSRGPDLDNIWKAVADAISKARGESDRDYTGEFHFLPTKELADLGVHVIVEARPECPADP